MSCTRWRELPHAPFPRTARNSQRREYVGCHYFSICCCLATEVIPMLASLPEWNGTHITFDLKLRRESHVDVRVFSIVSLLMYMLCTGRAAYCRARCLSLRRFQPVQQNRPSLHNAFLRSCNCGWREAVVRKATTQAASSRHLRDTPVTENCCEVSRGAFAPRDADLATDS